MSLHSPIALTGGIACGKSTLAEGLLVRGWHVIDTDRIAREVTAPGGPAWKNVVDAFGPSILQPDKSIDRKVLGRLVFADPALRAKLNEITHPAIRSVWQRELEERIRTHPTEALAVMIPLLFECELERLFSVIWCVGASRATQLCRLAGRGLTSEEAGQRLASQMPVMEKMARATVAFWGEGTPASLLRQIDQIHFS
ncbi:MAG TPA: dephospho-CoA kinase [Candidatus Methylacidiphilales bacterium]|nr:dephospho-CoA kinase [Candidatus Methylacidiphilales bacterium]